MTEEHPNIYQPEHPKKEGLCECSVKEVFNEWKRLLDEYRDPNRVAVPVPEDEDIDSSSFLENSNFIL